MFKNLTAYALPKAGDLLLIDLQEQLAAAPFQPCGPTQPTSWGFVPPTLTEHADLAEALGSGRIVVAVRRQERKVPGETLRKRVDELAKVIEQESGRKPGAKRRRELKDEAMLELLPQAFTKDTTALLLIDRDGGRLVIDSTSSGMLDGVLSTLCRAVPSFAPHPLNTLDSPASWMAKLLLDEPGGTLGPFGVGRSLELCSDDLAERRVAWRNADLSGEDVQRNLDNGARVVRMALEFNARTEFTLTETAQLKGLAIDLAAMAQPEGEPEVWRTDAELVTAELVLVLDGLESELGGRMAPLGAAA